MRRTTHTEALITHHDRAGDSVVPPKPPTIADVARLAQTSTAVVSYVVNNGPRPVSDAARLRVEAAIEELGWRPSRVAKGLSSRRSGLLGFVLPDSQNAFFSELGYALDRIAFEHGYLGLLGDSTFSSERETDYVRLFLDSGVEGLLLATSLSAQALDADTATRVPMVFLHRRPRGIHGTSVVLDDKNGGRDATRHLVGHGHRVIACIAGSDRLNPVASRITGWRQVMTEIGADTDGLLVGADYNRYSAYEATLRLFASRRDVTGVFATTDEHAIGVIRALSELGLRVPRDVAVVGFDGIREGAFMTPQLTTVSHPIENLARRSMELLVARIAGGGGPISEVLPTQLLVGASCGCERVRSFV